MLRKIYLLIRDFSAQMKKQNISSYASSTAFFFFLSLVPMLIVLCTVLPYTPLTEDDLETLLFDITPEMVNPLLHELINDVYQKSAGILSIAILATIWSAAKGVLALMRGLNAINGLEEKRNYFVIRGIASFYTIVMLVVLILSLFVMVFGNQFVNIALHRVPQLRLLVSFFMELRFIVVWVVLTILFAAIYAYVPNHKLRFKEQIPGACFSAVVWSVFSWGFSLYVSRSGAYSVYGSISIIIIVMIWMYFCMYIIMIGAYLNRYFQPVKRSFLTLSVIALCIMLGGCRLLPREKDDAWVGEGAALLDGDIRSGEFVLCGEVYSFPMELGVWIDRGWQVAGNYGNRDAFELAPFYISKEFSLTDGNGNSVSVCVYNDSIRSRRVEDCLVCELYIPLQDCRVVLPGGINGASTFADVDAVYSEPEYVIDTSAEGRQPCYAFRKDEKNCLAMLQDSLLCVAYIIQEDPDDVRYLGSEEIDADFCARYVDAALKTSFHGDWGDYVALGIDTAEGAAELYGSQVYCYAEALMQYVGVDVAGAGQETLASFDEIARAVLGKTMWEISNVTLNGRSMTGILEIKLYPTDYIDLIESAIEEDAESLPAALEPLVEDAESADPIVKSYEVNCADGILSAEAWHEIDQIIMGMNR